MAQALRDLLCIRADSREARIRNAVFLALRYLGAAVLLGGGIYILTALAFCL
jgi:hypothetical protein